MTNKQPSKEGRKENEITEVVRAMIEAKAKEFAGSNYNKNHFPDSWNNRNFGFCTGAEFGYLLAGGEEKRFTGNEKEMLEFVMYVTGNTEKTVLQIYRDWLNNKIYQ